jgi:hypothetical protein
LLILVVSTLLVVVGASAAGLAAPITGSNQAVPATDAEQAPPFDPNRPEAAADASATVIEFSVLPSADDPTQMETIVILQQGGGRRVCVNLKSTDVITRSYRKRGDEPFSPAIPGDIRGLTSGDTGSLVGFNDTKVFFRPLTIDDTFTDTDECFIAGEAEGCFLPGEDDCDQPLEEGDVACVMGTISRTGCALADHTNLTRQMRILVTLNQPPGEEPIITAADIPGAPQLPVPPEGPEGGLPEGPGPDGPTGEAPPVGGGGGSLVPVPNVLGLTLADAEAKIIAADLRLGTVTTVTVVGSLGNPFIRSARAQESCQSATVVVDTVFEQDPCPTDITGILVALDTLINLRIAQGPAAIPEPSSLALFAMGLGLLILITMWRRRRS